MLKLQTSPEKINQNQMIPNQQLQKRQLGKQLQAPLNSIPQERYQTLNDRLIAGIDELKDSLIPNQVNKKEQLKRKNQFLTSTCVKLIQIIQYNHSRGNVLKCLNPSIICLNQSFDNILLTKNPLQGRKNQEDPTQIYIKGQQVFIYPQQLLYIAPEGNKQVLKEPADVWSFGCILYEILSYGDPLITDPIKFHNSDSPYQQEFIKERMSEFHAKGIWMGLTTFFIQILSLCLSVYPSKRQTISKLKQQITLKSQLFLKVQESASKSKEQFLRKINLDLSLEILRLEMIMDSMLGVFQQFAYNTQKTLQKWHIYPLLKFASCYYIDVLSKCKTKARRYSYNNKFAQIKFMEKWKMPTAEDIKNKAAEKIEKEQIITKDLFIKYPQVRSYKIVYPKRVFRRYLNQKVLDLLCSDQNLPFLKYFYSLIFYMKETDEISSLCNLLKIKTDKDDSDFLYLRNSRIIMNFVQESIKKIIKDSTNTKKTHQAVQIRKRSLVQVCFGKR